MADTAKLGLTYDQLMALSPCAEERDRVIAVLGNAETWNGRVITAFEAREAGVSFDNILWAASAHSRRDKEVERRLRHFLADCAARVLPIFEKYAPSDDRPRKAIEAARLFADGKIGDAARAAARDAAWAAARAAAGDAAGAAAWAAARDAAWAAAGAAAWDAARDAAWAAARAAAGAAEQEWQFIRLCEWLSDSPPEPLALTTPKAEAA